MGKTTLAIEIVNSPDILEHFSDEVLWAGLGPDAELGIDVRGIPTEEDRSQAVKNAVGQRRMLLVIGRRMGH